MNQQEIEKMKSKLLTEKAQLEEELNGIGSKSNDTPTGWEPNAGGIIVDSADENEVADKLEEHESNSGIMRNLEGQLQDVTDALAKIEKGTYGICEACGKPIEKERLEANPSARNSLKHAH